MSIVNLAEGSIFAGRYKVVRSIAAGGMGAVYEVLHVGTARRRALKVMHPHLEQSDDFRKRFEAEARIAGQVESAYIVDVFDAGVDEATKMPFLVMELLKGEELGKRLRRVGKFEFQECVGYLWQTALALDKTHKANIVHRDLKPDNLFLCEEEEGPSKIKVLDFGIAKLMAEGGTQANVTRAMGTPLYMAPEQFKSKSKVSAATDIHALGMMAYAMLVGASYWAEEQATEDNPYAFASIVMQGPPEPPSVRALRRGMKLPEAFDEWFGQATSPNPEQRFFKATVAIRGLAQALGVEVPAGLTGHGSSMTDPQSLGIVSGQTAPGQTNAGQTGQTGSARNNSEPKAASSSGPQGTVVLDSTPPPADTGTHGSGYGLSESHPNVALTSSDSKGAEDVRVNAGPARSKRYGTMLVIGLMLCMLGIGVAVAMGKKTVAAADTPNSAQSEATAKQLEPIVSPKDPVTVMPNASGVAAIEDRSANSSPPPMESSSRGGVVNANTGTNSGLVPSALPALNTKKQTTKINSDSWIRD